MCLHEKIVVISHGKIPKILGKNLFENQYGNFLPVTEN